MRKIYVLCDGCGRELSGSYPQIRLPYVGERYKVGFMFGEYDLCDSCLAKLHIIASGRGDIAVEKGVSITN